MYVCGKGRHSSGFQNTSMSITKTSLTVGLRGRGSHAHWVVDGRSLVHHDDRLRGRDVDVMDVGRVVIVVRMVRVGRVVRMVMVVMV